MSDYKPLIWDSSFETGVSEIDEQHRILVNTINEAAVTLGENSNLAILEQITNDLLSYALYHFETEEELMNEYNYEEAPDEDMQTHLSQHRDFSSTVVTVKDNMKSGKPITKDELLNFLKNWLTNHILYTDKKFGAFILAKRAENS
jgi:hemerythrin-like metal-binding protein